LLHVPCAVSAAATNPRRMREITLEVVAVFNTMALLLLLRWSVLHLFAYIV
jgi:hypothetical protein